MSKPKPAVHIKRHCSKLVSLPCQVRLIALHRYPSLSFVSVSQHPPALECKLPSLRCGVGDPERPKASEPMCSARDRAASDERRNPGTGSVEVEEAKVGRHEAEPGSRANAV